MAEVLACQRQDQPPCSTSHLQRDRHKMDFSVTKSLQALWRVLTKIQAHKFPSFQSCSCILLSLEYPRSLVMLLLLNVKLVQNILPQEPQCHFSRKIQTGPALHSRAQPGIHMQLTLPHIPSFLEDIYGSIRDLTCCSTAAATARSIYVINALNFSRMQAALEDDPTYIYIYICMVSIFTCMNGFLGKPVFAFKKSILKLE